MKRFFTLLLVVAMLGSTAYGWGRLGHATIAKIAEDHLTPKAKTLITKYLDGASIIEYASYPDDYRHIHLIDLGFEPSNSPRKVVWGHSYQANADGTLFHGERKGNEYVKNCTGRIEGVIKDFAENHKTMSDSARVVSLAFIVHIVGDIHCPKHIRYTDEPTSGGYKVDFFGRKISYHAYWDGEALMRLHRWGFSDLAYLLDRYSKSEIAAIQQGDIYSWAEENAKESRFTLETKAGDSITRSGLNRDVRFAEKQLRHAGYRLAGLLNKILK